MTPGRRFLMVAPAVFDEADFPAIAVYLTGAEYTGEELDSDTWQAELHIEVFPALLRCRIQSWIRGWKAGFIRAMSDIPALVRIWITQYGGQWL